MQLPGVTGEKGIIAWFAANHVAANLLMLLRMIAAYEAVRDSTITGRPSYHSPDEDISVSNAQGCAMGRRGDGADGHSWAGGLGALLDSEGNDKYISGNWSMGTGYWFGMGLLHDGAGDDEYRGVVWSQATGAHHQSPIVCG